MTKLQLDVTAVDETELAEKLLREHVTTVAALTAIHARGVEREAQQREWEAERERRAQLAREAEGERRLRVRMVTHMRSWERATRLRSFVAEVERIGTIQRTNAAELKAWLTWAKAHIECLDPTLSNIEEVVSLTVDVPEHFDNAYRYGPKPVDWWQLRDDDV